jgi:hypothetical protein
MSVTRRLGSCQMWCTGKEALCMHHLMFSYHFKNVHSDLSCECTCNRVNVFERGVMLPGCLKVSLAAAILC